VEPEVRNKLDLAIEIRDVYAREILDFAGNPAIEVEVLAGGEIIGKASMAGKNYSKKEQTEKQQVHIEEKIELLNSQIAPEIIGENVFEQRKIDTILKENGTDITAPNISGSYSATYSTLVSTTYSNAFEISVDQDAKELLQSEQDSIIY